MRKDRISFIKVNLQRFKIEIDDNINKSTRNLNNLKNNFWIFKLALPYLNSNDHLIIKIVCQSFNHFLQVTQKDSKLMMENKLVITKDKLIKEFDAEENKLIKLTTFANLVKENIAKVSYLDYLDYLIWRPIIGRLLLSGYIFGYAPLFISAYYLNLALPGYNTTVDALDNTFNPNNIPNSSETCYDIIDLLSLDGCVDESDGPLPKLCAELCDKFMPYYSVVLGASFGITISGIIILAILCAIIVNIEKKMWHFDNRNINEFPARIRYAAAISYNDEQHISLDDIENRISTYSNNIKKITRKLDDYYIGYELFLSPVIPNRWAQKNVFIIAQNTQQLIQYDENNNEKVILTKDQLKKILEQLELGELLTRNLARNQIQSIKETLNSVQLNQLDSAIVLNGGHVLLTRETHYSEKFAVIENHYLPPSSSDKIDIVIDNDEKNNNEEKYDDENDYSPAIENGAASVKLSIFSRQKFDENQESLLRSADTEYSLAQKKRQNISYNLSLNNYGR